MTLPIRQYRYGKKQLMSTQHSFSKGGLIKAEQFILPAFYIPETVGEIGDTRITSHVLCFNTSLFQHHPWTPRSGRQIENSKSFFPGSSPPFHPDICTGGGGVGVVHPTSISICLLRLYFITFSIVFIIN